MALYSRIALFLSLFFLHSDFTVLTTASASPFAQGYLGLTRTMSAEMFLQCFNGILESKVIDFSYFNVLRVIINQYQVMMTFKGEDV